MTPKRPRRPLKTVLLLQDLEFGGTQRYAINLLKHLSREFFDPEMWVLRGGMDMAPLALETGCRIKWLSRSQKFVGPGALVKLFYGLMRRPPDILYALTGIPNIWGRPFARLAGVPVIITGWRSLVEKQCESLLWPLSTRIVCNAQALKDSVVHRHSVDPSRVAVIPNAVDTEYFCSDGRMKSADPLVLFIGRFVKEKDPLTLVEAFRLVLAKIPSARLIMVGNGPLEYQLEAHIKSRAIQRIDMLPSRPETRDLLRSAWVFAMSSKREGMPNVILEAMATSVPVVGTHAGGIPEIVAHGETGLLVPPCSPKELADALIEVLDNEILRDRLAAGSREKIRRSYSMEVMIRETERVLLEAAQETGIL